MMTVPPMVKMKNHISPFKQASLSENTKINQRIIKPTADTDTGSDGEEKVSGLLLQGKVQ